MKFSNISFHHSQKIIHQIISRVGKALWVLGQDAFLFIILFILLDMAFGEFLVYKHMYLPQSRDLEYTANPITFKEQAYQSVLKKWQIREENVTQSVWENYTDPFQ